MSSLRYLLPLVGVVLLTFQAEVVSAKKIDGDRLLAPDHLLDIRIELAEADWNKLRVQARNPGAFFSGGAIEERPYTYFKADIWIDDTKIESVGVRKKGLFGSADNNRPSLKVKFDEFIKQDPIKGLSRLTLNNNKQDKSQLSQLLTYKLFRDAGIHAPRSNLARVTVNGRYLGIYSNVESIRKPFLNHRFGDKSGNLYEGTLTDFHPRTIDKLEVKTNAKSNDRKDIQRLADLLAAEGELDIAELEQVINVDYFIRYWALEGMTGFWDGYASNQNNFFLYMNPKDGLGYFIPWGADWVLTSGGPFGGFSQGNSAIYAQSILANRLYKSEGVPERYRETVLRLLDEVWNEEELLAQVKQFEALITPHLHESQRDAPRAIGELRAFIQSRRKQLQDELKNWPARVPEEPRTPMHTVAVGEFTGSLETTWSERPPADGSRVGKADVQFKLEGKVVKFEQIGVTASAARFTGFGRPGFGGRPGAGQPANVQPPVAISFSGIRQSDGQPVTLSLTIDRSDFTAAENAIDVTGRLTEGRGSGFGFGGFGRGRSLNGKLRLTKSGTEEGDEIAGTIDLKVEETRGGFFNQRRGGGGRPGPRPPATRPGAALGRPAILRALDKDNDGVLSNNEVEGATEALLRLDRNQDGELTADELSVSSPGISPTRAGEPSLREN